MIYSPREKLQLLRKQYKISQLELVMNNISRSHLAMIETGKTKLSKKVAKSLVENFNYILNNKGITESITLEYLIEDTNMQIAKKKSYYIETLNKGILKEELITEIEDFIKVSDDESKVVLYSKIGDMYFAANHLKKAFGYYSRTFDEALIINESGLLENLVLKLATINCKNNDFAINSILERAVKHRLSEFTAVKKELIINKFIISFSHLDENDKGITYIDMLLKETVIPDKIYQLELMKANFFEKKKVYINAISIYRGMLLKYKDERKKLKISINLMNAYKLKGELVKVESYYKKNLASFKKIDLCEEYPHLEEQCLNYEMGLTSMYLEKPDKAIEFFKKVLEPIAPCANEVLAATLYNILKLANKADFDFIKNIENIYFVHILKKDDYKIGYLFLSYYNNYEFNIAKDKFLNRICSIL